MLKEVNELFNNIKKFRQLLKESVGENDVIDAINKHKIIYIYYKYDGQNLPGYRTIHPFVLGTSTAGNKVIRAWQEAGSSDSYAGLTGRKREDHEYGFDKKGKMRPGWRLFRVDKITSFLPTGKFFSSDESKVPNLYNPNDKQMTSIVAAVQVGSGKPETQVSGIESIDKPDVIKQKLPNPPSEFSGQKEKFQYFSKVGKKQREVTVDEIKHLWGIAKKIKKKSPEKLLVVTDQNGDMILKDIGIKDKIPAESIVGNLKDLYLKYVKPNEVVDDSFFKKEKESIERKTFFK